MTTLQSADATKISAEGCAKTRILNCMEKSIVGYGRIQEDAIKNLALSFIYNYSTSLEQCSHCNGYRWVDRASNIPWHVYCTAKQDGVFKCILE